MRLMFYHYLLYSGLHAYIILFVNGCCSDQYTNQPSHLKPFGSQGPHTLVEERDEFPDSKEFFSFYVDYSKPLKIKNGASSSPAFTKWTDGYFLSIDVLKDLIVSVEDSKIENRTKPFQDMTFNNFLNIYNTSNQYLVNSVPDIIRSDILLPLPLQCSEIYKNILVENVMWMSSGGTSSVVHTDSVDNIICTYRGRKQIYLLDPFIPKNQNIIDFPNGGYSGIDVIRVNYSKYTDLVNASFYTANLNAGDCLYIPYKWIHQVLSENSNIAVNIWWDHTKIKNLDLESCRREESVTLSDAIFHGFTSTDLTYFKEHLLSSINEQVSLYEFIRIFVKENEDISQLSSLVLAPLRHMFYKIDSNKDHIVTKEEASQLIINEWELLEAYYKHFETGNLSEFTSKEEL